VVDGLLEADLLEVQDDLRGLDREIASTTVLLEAAMPEAGAE
jgi:hypothetical protein